MDKNDNTLTNREIGLRIQSKRKELGLTLKEIADKVGVASSTIQRYEKGTITQIKLPVLESIAKVLDINPTWLVKRDAPLKVNFTENTSSKENILIVNFNKLNDLGKDEALKRIEELTYINRYTNTHLVLAAHADDENDAEKLKLDIDMIKADNW